MTKYTSHVTVLLNEVVDSFIECSNIDDSPLYADCTFGGGGHSFKIIESIKNSKLMSIDQDPEALKNGRERIVAEGMTDRIQLMSGNFENFKEHLKEFKLSENKFFNGIVIDLGVSSHHFDDFSRGFSFREDAPLDMRMNNGDNEIKTAAEILNTYSKEELINIFQDYGEEKFSRRIAERIVEQRVQEPIKTTKELEDIAKACYPANLRYGKINPATKVFQALRIEVNNELGVIRNVLDQLLSSLKIGGRLAIISFHSLEDRIVKHKFKEASLNKETPFKILTKKPILPKDEEILHNSRSRSAKLRVIERVLEIKNKNKYAKIKE